MTQKEYAELVNRMRYAQKNYFRIARDYAAKPSQKSAALDLSKQLEKEVDEATHNILNPVPTTQPNLFNS